MQYVNALQQGGKVIKGLNAVLLRETLCASLGLGMDADDLDVGAMDPPGSLKVKAGGKASASDTGAHLRLAHAFAPPANSVTTVPRAGLAYGSVGVT